MGERIKGQIGLFIVAIIWGSGFVMSSIALESFSPIHILALRFTTAFVAMLILFSKQFKYITKATLIKGGMLGIILYLAFFFQTVGLVYTTPSKNAFLTAFNVVLVPLIGVVFLRKKMSGMTIIGSIFAIIGIAIMSLNDFNSVNIGDVLTLVCAVFFALQIIYTSTYVAGENPFALNTIQMGAAALIAIVVAVIQGETMDFSNTSGNLSRYFQYNAIVSITDRITTIYARNRNSDYPLYRIGFWNVILSYSFERIDFCSYVYRCCLDYGRCHFSSVKTKSK